MSESGPSAGPADRRSQWHRRHDLPAINESTAGPGALAFDGAGRSQARGALPAPLSCGWWNGIPSVVDGSADPALARSL